MWTLLLAAMYGPAVSVAGTGESGQQSGMAYLRQLVEETKAELKEDPGNTDLRYQLGAIYNELAVRGDEEALEKALKIFKQICESHPERTEALAFYGSMVVLKARYANIFRKNHYARQGFEILDRAVMEAPRNPQVRLIRAGNSAEVPGILGRGDEAQEDFQWLFERYREEPERFPPKFRRVFFVLAGKYLLDKGDPQSLKFLEKAKELPGSAHLTPQLKEELRKARKRFAENVEAANPGDTASQPA